MLTFQPPMPRRSATTDNWTKFALFLLYGFMVAGKPFVYAAGPLVALWFFNRGLCRQVYTSLTRQDSLSGVSWALLLSIMYGIWEVVYGVLAGNNPVYALRILVFNFCPLYLFVGIWAGARRPGTVHGYIRFQAWLWAIYAPIYFIFLSRLNSNAVPAPAAGSMVILGLLCFEPRLLSYWFPLVVSTFTLIANEIRGDWVGFGVGIAVWGTVTKRLGKLFSVAGIIFALLLIGFVTDARLPAIPGRGGEISARDTIGRLLSGMNPELAQEYSSSAAGFAGTVAWRQNWWKAIREEVSRNYSTLAFGLGYGYPINRLVPYLKGQEDLHTPHSILYFNLAYSGCIGVVVFFSLQVMILRLLWRTYKETGQIFGLIWHVSTLVSAFFGNIFENPLAAIPHYLIVGLCIGPMFWGRYGVADRPDWKIPFPARMKMGRFAPSRTSPQASIPSRFAPGPSTN
jgi:hypothetical protein